MKLAALLAQYLYTHKRLDLPGMGSFFIVPTDNTEPEPAKQEKPESIGPITFESNPSIKKAPELEAYISSQTGKIKALAAADLDSHLEQALQFLNIGKPFLLEGIGSLNKLKSGQFSFTAGQAIPEMMKDNLSRENATTPSTEESLTDFKTIFYPRKEKINWKKPVAFLLLLAGIAIAIWGGYKMYKKTSEKNNELPEAGLNDTTNKQVAVMDTIGKQTVDTASKKTTFIPAGNFKFVLETSNAQRAFDRFSRLKTFQWDVQMETSDSISYKIFMLLNAAPGDTSKILDSLTRLNGRRVYIE
ncbi:MAG: hypothetical protein WBB06_13290 [Chitinophagaceae bacterium]